MGQQLKALQEERDALHNLNINAIKLYVNKIVTVLQERGVDLGNIKAGTKIYVPSHDAINVIDLVRDLHPIQLTAEENSWRYAQMRSMITDYRFGLEQKGVERPTARGVMMLLSESNKISNFVIDNIKDVLKEIGYTLLIWSYMDKVNSVLSKKEKKQIEQVKSLQKIKDIINIEIGINSAVLNKEIQRNNVIAIIQILGGYLEQVMPAFGQYFQAPPPVKEALEKIIKISDELLAKAIRTFDIEIDKPELHKILEEAKNEAGAPAEAMGNLAQTLSKFRELLLQRAGQGENLGAGMPTPGQD
jgi:hypothetical protein